MKIQLKDFGPISSFEFDLDKDLHVIFGKNNIGKSYAITAVYLILKNLLSSGADGHFPNESLFFYLNRGDNDPNQILKKIDKFEKEIIDEFDKTATKEINITNKISLLITQILNAGFVQKIENAFKNSFSSLNSLSNRYSKEHFSITLSFKSFAIVISGKDQSLLVKEVSIYLPIIVKKVSVFKRPVVSQDKKITYYNSKEKSVDLAKDCINDFIFDLVDKVKSKINKVYFLPASRSGLYQGLSTFSSMIAELSKSRNFLSSNKFELPNISETVSDYFLELSNISLSDNNDFNEVIEFLEKDVLKGRISFNTENKKIVFYQTELNHALDLSFTSSMISEIAPIVAYLKYIIGNEEFSFINESEKYGLIFIEEPEAHLHPEVQVKLMEMFAVLAGKNVKIVMTSHSNYMFNKLSNLLLDGKIDPDSVGSYLMKATDFGSVTDTLSMKAEKDGMNDENFADTAEMLYEERIKIYDRLNNDVANAH